MLTLVTLPPHCCGCAPSVAHISVCVCTCAPLLCRRGLLWKIPVTLLSLGLAAAGGYFGYKQYEEYRDKQDKKEGSSSSSKAGAKKK